MRMRRTLCCVLTAGFLPFVAMGRPATEGPDGLVYRFSGGYGQVEVGGVYAGVEFHKSRPLPSRISFYYPVANSIDLSTDYWQRDESRPMVVGVRLDGGARRWLGKEAWGYDVSPHTVRFHREEEALRYAMAYHFCLNESAFVWRVVLHNASPRAVRAEVYTHLRTALRTCQTYARMDSAWTEVDSSLHALITHNVSPQAGSASIVVQNVGVVPSLWTTSARELGIQDSGWSRWISSGFPPGLTLTPSNEGSAVAAFVYDKTIAAGDSLVILQVISSLKKEEVPRVTKRLRASWENEVAAYDRYVRSKASGESTIVTGIAQIDRAVIWDRAILAANAHYLDGAVVPMPCPAEYNFFFTHDVLLTNLAAVNFDLPRVKHDLLYIASHAREGIIPHAYYWRDDGYKTEYCTPDNWNHLWFIIVCASYLRHSMDDSTSSVLYPLVTKSLKEILQQRRDDDLMYAFRPDWWDIGHKEGPRAYITILTIRALRDYLFLSSALGKNTATLPGYEALAKRMQLALEERLWDSRLNYLINFNGGMKDEHYYMGSLLGAAYRLLSADKARLLVATATRELLDPRIGLRNAMPPDFHLDSVRAFFKFAGNEAGDPYTYANGGVWAHGNAWYALSLAATGQADSAFRFFERVMTVDGVLQSPNGLPALGEYRYANPASPRFGAIDKPSFLWAGGFSLYTLFHLLGIEENEWNVSILGPVPSALDQVHYSFAFGEVSDVRVNGTGNMLREFRVGTTTIPSAVVPIQAKGAELWAIRRGKADEPYLESITAILHSASYREKNRELTYEISSFDGHQVEAKVISRTPAKAVLISGTKLEGIRSERIAGGMIRVHILIPGTFKRQTLEILF